MYKSDNNNGNNIIIIIIYLFLFSKAIYKSGNNIIWKISQQIENV